MATKLSRSAKTAKQPAVKPRKMDFPFDDMEDKYWYGGNSILTAFFAALSAVFPPGEQQFIKSVRHYRDQITDPELKEQIRGFIGQEGHHSHQHKKANQTLDRLGLFATRLEKHLEKDIARLNHLFSPEDQLAQTVAMEHFTAVLAEYALTHDEMTDPMTPAVKELILWHAIEEIEHKAVAFDVYETCVGDRKRLHKNMRIVSTEFLIRIFCYQAAILYWDRKIPSIKDIVGAGKFFFGKRGVARAMYKPLREFFKEDFHPWDHDNTQLVDEWKQTHTLPAEMQAA